MSSAHALSGLSSEEKRRWLKRKLAERAGHRRAAPLSHGQKALWFLHQLSPESVAQNVMLAWRLCGPVEPESLRRAFQGLIDRHASLRTTYAARGGAPEQRVEEHREVDFEVLAATDWTEARLKDEMAARGHVPFDLERGSVLRVTLFRRRPPSSDVLLLAVHHIAIDGWSLALMLRELGELYTRGLRGKPQDLGGESRPYTDFARWQEKMLAGGEGTRMWNYWRRQFTGDLPVLELPTDRPRPASQTYQGASRAFRLRRTTTRELKRFARENETTLYTVLLAAFQILLHRFTGSTDLVVASPTSGREREEFAGTVGYFVNPVALRIDVSGSPTLGEVVRRTRETGLAGLEHSAFPFPLLVERLVPDRDPARPPLCNVSFVLQRPHQLGRLRRSESGGGVSPLGLQSADEQGMVIELGDLLLESYPLAQQAVQYDFELQLIEAGESLSGAIQYNVDLFDPSTVGRMVRHYRQCLDHLLAHPDRRLGELPALPRTERHQLLMEWSETVGSLRARSAEASCLHRLFERRAALEPEREALRLEDRSWHFGELNRRANRLAHHLRALGLGAEGVVAVYLHRSLESVVALLAVFKAGGVYLPLDAEDPIERLEYLVHDARVAVVLTESELRERLPQHGAREICLDDEAPAIAARSEEDLCAAVEAEHLAYLIYTSGSTGRPKGVAVQHGEAVQHCRAIRVAHGLTPADRVLQFAASSFDVSLEQLLPALFAGACVVLRGPELWSPQDFCRHAADLSVANLPTAFWSQLTRELDRGLKLPNEALRLLIAGGERMPVETAARWRELVASVDLLNAYGPTEAVMTSNLFAVAADLRATPSASVPLGRTFGDRRLYLLDAAERPVPIGAAGELCLAGPLLARGYYHRRALTATRFLPDPFASTPGARLYRSGDLARRGVNGDVEFLGRCDRQVKMRGFRIELGEIEAVLARHPEVGEAAVVAHGVTEDEKRLWAYVASERQEPGLRQRITDHLRDHLPSWMVPSAVQILTELPLTASGKIDRQRLPALADLSDLGQGPYQAPCDPFEESLSQIWSQVLGTGGRALRIGVHDNFFELGGHSLLATQVIARIRDEFGVELAVREVFERPTVAQLAARLRRALGAEKEERGGLITAVPRDRDLPASFAQRRLWFLDRLSPGDPSYNMPGAFRLSGGLDSVALDRSLCAIERRHEALRTRFLEVDGEPLQHIAPPRERLLSRIDLSALPASRKTVETERWRRGEALRGFDLSCDPLLRACLLRLGSEEHLLLLTLHHIVADGWSVGLLLEELAAFYGAWRGPSYSPDPEVPELPIQYADFADWQHRRFREGAFDHQLGAWREELGGALPHLDLAGQKERPTEVSNRGARLDFEFSSALAERLETFARSDSASLFMVLLSAYQILLQRWTGEDRITVGSPIANRSRREVERLIGFFVNSIVLRTDLGDDPSFRKLLGRVRETTLKAYTHQDFPFESLVEELQPDRSTGHQPLFQVLLALQNTPPASAELPGLDVVLEPPVEGTAKFDLTVSLERGPEGLRGFAEYRTDLLESSDIVRFVRHFEGLLLSAVAAPDRRLSQLPHLDAAEHHQLVVEWNDRRTAYPDRLTVHELFAEQVERRGEAVAAVYRGRSLSYAELDRQADRIAHHLRRTGVGSDALVAVCLERSLELAVSILAILKAEAAYVPLDPAYPPERLSLILEDSGAAALLTQRRLFEALPFEPPPGVRRLMLDSAPFDGREELDRGASETGEARARPQNLAYMMYTSGSTGKPKGVGVSHRAIVRLVRETDYIDLGPRNRVAQAANASFDAATFEIWGPWLTGGCVVGLDREVTLSPESFAAALFQQRVDTLFLTTALFNELAHQQPAAFSNLRQVLFGGEAVSPRWVRRVLEGEARPDRLLHVYGPTESTTFASWQSVVEVSQTASTIPVGRPLANTEIYVLGRGLRPVSVGVAGELYIGGHGLARSYHGRARLTATKFIPHPLGPSAEERGARLYRTGDLVRQNPRGELIFLGRIDRQVKLRGFRIEPGEIEATLLRHPAVRQAVVEVDDPPDGERRLVAYVAPKEAGLDVRALREDLGGQLPEFMVPAAFLVLGHLPLNANGKVDRRALPEFERSTGEPQDREARSLTPLEELVLDTCAHLLGVERVGVGENFFELGGHSLLATRLNSRLRTLLGVQLPLAVIFEAPTFGELIAAIDELRGKEPVVTPPLEAALPGELPVPSFAQERLWFVEQLAPGNAQNNIPAALRLTGPLNIVALGAAGSAIVRRHEVLRTALHSDAGRLALEVCEPRRLGLPVVDLSGLLPSLHLKESRRQARAEARRPFDLSRPPHVRSTVIRLTSHDHLVLVTFHHIAADGASWEIFLRELSELYAAALTGRGASLPVLTVQYADFARWQRRCLLEESVLASQLRYWKERLAGAPPSLEIPTDRPRPAVRTLAGGRHDLRWSADLRQKILELGRREGTTPFMTLLAALNAWLHRFTNQDDIMIGSPIVNRARRELEDLVGMFVNTLVLRSDLSGRPSFRQLLERVRAGTLEAFAHQDLPFERLVDELHPQRDLSHTPLFQVMLALYNGTGPQPSFQELSLQVEGVESRTSKFDLSLLLTDDGVALRGSIEYSTELFDASTIARLAGQLTALLSSAAEDPGLLLGELELFDRAHRHQLLIDWNDTSSASPGAEGLIHRWIEAQVRRHPEAPAVISEQGRVSYGELDERARYLARILTARGVEAGMRIGLCGERSPEMIIGILGILKAGAAYVPLDPHHPQERLDFLIEDAGMSLLLLGRGSEGRLPATTAEKLSLEESVDGRISADSPPRPSAVTSAHPVYVIYTSGSTGKPKGVAIHHQNLVSSTHARFDFYEEPVGRYLLLSPLTFDSSVAGLFWTLCQGGALVLPPGDFTGDPEKLLEMVHRESVTHLLAIPSLYEQLLNLPRAERLASLKVAIVAGEACSRQLVRAHGELLPQASLYNEYGPTEATVWCTAHRLVACEQGHPVPIGRPIANTETYVVDRRLEPVPLKVPGELCVAGEGLASVYLGRARLTAERFSPDPFSRRCGGRLYHTGDRIRTLDDGNLEFLGRADDQVKVRGFRIELGEIEEAVNELPGVGDAAVIARQAGSHARLVAYWVKTPGREVEVEALRVSLGERLPEYMVPRSWVELPELPRNPNGKVDRRNLPEPEPEVAPNERASEPPRGAAEEILLEIWEGVLGLEGVGIHDNFFELGGDSILSLQISARAHQRGLRLTPRQIFERQTVAGLAAVASWTTDREEGGEPAGPVPLTPIQHWFFERDLAAPQHYNQSLLLAARRPLDPSRLAAALKALGAHHDAFRMRFDQRDEARVSTLASSIEEPLVFCDFSALPVAARRGALAAAGARIQASFDLSRGPIWRAAWFAWGGGHGRLLLVLHHLAVDGVSWRVLLEHLETAYRQLETPSEVRLPRSTSFRRWSARLREHAHTPEVRRELNDWLEILDTDEAEPLPRDFPAGGNRSGAAANVEVELAAEETDVLLHQAQLPYRTRVEEMLLAALLRAASRWCGRPELLVDLEGHGRGDFDEDLDLSATVGWFTAIYPLLLRDPGGEHHGELLKAVKEARRAVPGQGLGYGLLRHLGGDQQASARLKALPRAEVSFNYLGQFDAQLDASTLFQLTEEPCGPEHSPIGERPYTLEVSVFVSGGRLRSVWRYPSEQLQESTVEALAGDFIAVLHRLLEHCSGTSAGGFTPSDFPLTKGIRQGEIDRLQTAYPGLEDLYPLSPAQQGMLYHTLRSPSSGVYVEQLACTLVGKLDTSAFAEAWQRLLARHPALRSAFLWEDVAEFLQVTDRNVRMPVDQEDWRTRTPAEQRRSFDRLVQADRDRGFDPGTAPLMRLSLIRIAEDRHRVLWSHHHLLMDGWCLARVLEEVFALYRELSGGPPVKLPAARPYREYVGWLQRRRTAPAETFWRRVLGGVSAATPLPGEELARGGSSGEERGEKRGAEHALKALNLSPALTADLQRVAQRHNLTLNTLVQGAWALMLSHMSSRDHVVFGATVSTRPAELDGVESMVGLFINTLPVPAEIAPQASLIPWLEDLQNLQLEAREHLHAPLVQIQSWSGLKRGQSLFETIVVYGDPSSDSSLDTLGLPGDLRVEEVEGFEQTNYPLTLAVSSGRQLTLELNYDRGRFPEPVLTRVLACLEAFCGRIREGETLGELKASLAQVDARLRKQQMQEQKKLRRHLLTQTRRQNVGMKGDER